jgi:hypothetical protein
MRVIYKPWLMKAIHKIRMDAMDEAKEIEKIVLSKAEWKQLESECCVSMNPMEWHNNFYGPQNSVLPRHVEVYGIKVERE